MSLTGLINIRNLALEVIPKYNKIVEWFDNARTKSLMEREYLELLLAHLKPGSHILDLGCGTGEPIAKFFIEKNMQVTGIDGASKMIELCRQRFPEMEWQVADMRKINLGKKFAAIIAWDSFFHLSREEQRRMIPVFKAHIEDDGILLFTSGPKDGEVYSTMDGQRFYHSSLDTEEYRELLADYGFTVLLNKVEDLDCGGHTVWVARYNESFKSSNSRRNYEKHSKNIINTFISYANQLFRCAR